MICDHPKCTGVHKNVNYPAMCPAAKEKRVSSNKRARDRNRLFYLKQLLRDRRRLALKRIAKRKEQYGKI